MAFLTQKNLCGSALPKKLRERPSIYFAGAFGKHAGRVTRGVARKGARPARRMPACRFAANDEICKIGEDGCQLAKNALQLPGVLFSQNVRKRDAAGIFPKGGLPPEPG